MIELTEKDGKPAFEHRAGGEECRPDTRFDWIDAVLPEVPPGKTLEEVVASLAEAGHAMKAKEVQSCLRADREGRWLSRRMKDRKGGPYGYWQKGKD